MSKLLEFINSNSNWKELISAEPYFVEVKEDGDYILLKYNQLNSNFSNPLVCECRGCIVKNINGRYEFVCRPFDKFFNYGEPNAADIDWSSALATEKVDGSLMKVWWDKKWHLSTNGTIDAFKARIEDKDISFGDIFYRIFNLSNDSDFQKLFSGFYKDCTYMFEITSPESRVVINYSDGVYLLAMRYNLSGNYGARNFDQIYTLALKSRNFHMLKIHSALTLNDCIDLVSKMNMDHEGVVVKDKYNNRIKIKSPEYLFRAKLYGAGDRSDEYLLDIILQSKDDDFLAYCPEYSDRVSKLKKCIEKYNLNCKNLWERFEPMLSIGRRDFAVAIANYPEKYYLFAKADNKIDDPIDYLRTLSISSVMKFLQNYFQGERCNN